MTYASGSASPSADLELYTFSISHFCEKARWALDRAQLPYRERVLVPGAHFAATRRRAGQSTVPILVHGARVVQGSIAIYDYIDTDLAPGVLSRGNRDDDTARSWEVQLDDALGVSGRRIAYSGRLSEMYGVAELWCQGAPFWARTFYRFSFSLVMRKVQHMYQSGDEDAVRRAVGELDAAFDALDGVLSRQAYFAGDTPGRVDFAVASLLAPLRFPAEHPVPWCYTPTALHGLCERYASRPTFQHVERMYREHRHTGAPYRLARGGRRVSPSSTRPFERYSAA